jgi:hypothetical protein
MKSAMLHDVSYSLPMKYGGDDTARSTELSGNAERKRKASF